MAAASAAPTFSIRRAGLDGAYPGDFNGDGITDLATTARGGGGEPVPAVALGRGDGTFGTPIKAAAVGRVFGTGDFNNDGKLDLIGFNTAGAPDEDVFVLAGRGDGTFGAGGAAATLYQIGFVLSADFDNDGNRDIAVSEFEENGDERLVLFRGHGDLTFDAPVSLATRPDLMAGIAIDLNGDGRRDIAVVNYFEQTLTVFLNDGGMTFTPRVVPGPLTATGITAADVTGDGKRDLVVTSAGSGSGGGVGYDEGFVSVLPGNGDGSFGAATQYQVARGAYKVVVADVTRDNVLDIVTANRSSIYIDDSCGLTLKTWDSISVLTGAGNGTFRGPDNFSIGNQLNPQLTDGRDRNTVSSLLISDVNGDGATDLITSGGTIFLNQPSDPNWAPTVNLGPDQTYLGSSDVAINAPASDVDQDMLTYSWISDDGRTLSPTPNPCLGMTHPYGTFHYTVTVDDGHGHTASDTIAITFQDPAVFQPSITIQAPTSNEVIQRGQPYTLKWHVHNPTGQIFTVRAYFSADGGQTYTIADNCGNLSTALTADEDMSCAWNTPTQSTTNGHILINGFDDDNMYVTGAVVGPITIRGAAGGLPSPWASQDIGAVGAPGTATYSNGIFTVTGSGADIWGNADEFRYVYRQNPGPIAGVELITHVDSVQSVNAWTKAGLMVRTSADPGAVHASLFVSPGKGIAFQRRVTAGGTSTHTAGPAWTAPVWLRLTVRGGTACTPTCASVTVVRAYYRKNTSDTWIFLGEQQYAGTQDQFALVGLAVSSHVDGTLATAKFSSVTAREKPHFAGAAIGTTDATANFVADDSWTLSASGADIWGSADQFLYTYTQTPSTAITARVKSLSNTNAWSKAGVMYRASTSAGSAHVMIVVTPGKGVAMQYRPTTGGTSAQVGQVLGVTAPTWVRLTHSGTTYTGSYSTDGLSWKTLGSVNIAGLTGQNAGAAITSHATARATAVFESVYVEP
jgi:hypothetical protein